MILNALQCFHPTFVILITFLSCLCYPFDYPDVINFLLCLQIIENAAFKALSSPESKILLEIVVSLFSLMEKRSIFQGEIAIVRACASKKIPIERTSVDFGMLLNEFLSCGAVISPLHFDEDELKLKERELMKKCSALAKEIDEKKLTLRSLVSSATFDHVFGFVERMIGHVKTDIGKTGTAIADGTFRTHKTYKMVHFGWHNFLRDISSSKPLIFSNDVEANEHERGYDDDTFLSIEESSLLATSELNHTGAAVSSPNPNDSGIISNFDASISDAMDDSKSDNTNANLTIENGSSRRRRQRRSRKNKKAKELSRL